MAIKKEVLDELLAEAGGKDVFGKDGLFNDLKKALAERILNAEMDHHLASEAEGEELKRGNHRNGYSKKRVLTDTAHLDIDIPRDRAGSFEPELIAKYQRRFPGFDEKVVSMYARGLTVREIQGQLQELCGIEVSPDLISTVTDAVLEEVAKWQSRPLDPTYTIVFSVPCGSRFVMKAVCATKRFIWLLAYALMAPKNRLVCGLNRPKGPKFWLRVMNDLKARGVNDILIATVDGLKGFPEAIGAVFPLTQVQTCIVQPTNDVRGYLIRHSMSFAPWKDRKPITAALKDIYRAKDAETARQNLDAFDASPWAENIQRLLKAGGAIGAKSSLSLLSLSLCDGLFTPHTDEALLRGLPSKA